MTSISLNEAQAALKAKMESCGEGHVFQYATDGLELHTLCKQLSAVDMDRQKELYKKVICAAEALHCTVSGQAGPLNSGWRSRHTVGFQQTERKIPRRES